MKYVVDIAVSSLVAVMLIAVPYFLWLKPLIATNSNDWSMFWMVTMYGYMCWTFAYYLGDKAGDLYKRAVIDMRIVKFRACDNTSELILLVYKIPKRSHQKLAGVLFDLLVHNSSVTPNLKPAFEQAMKSAGIKYEAITNE